MIIEKCNDGKNVELLLCVCKIDVKLQNCFKNAKCNVICKSVEMLNYCEHEVCLKN